MIETDLAWMVEGFDSCTNAWLPKSQIQDYSELEYEAGDDLEIEIPEWLALKKGLI